MILCLFLFSCFGCVTKDLFRGDGSLLYYDEENWLEEAVNDILSEEAFEHYSAATSEIYSQFKCLQGKILRLDIVKIEGAEEVRPLQFEPYEMYTVIHATEGTNICEVFLGERFLVKHKDDKWLNVNRVFPLDSGEWDKRANDSFHLEVKVDSNLIGRYLERAVSPIKAYPGLDLILKRTGLDRPILVAPLMRCSAGTVFVYSIPLQGVFELTIPDQGSFDEDVFMDAPLLFLRRVDDIMSIKTADGAEFIPTACPVTKEDASRTGSEGSWNLVTRWQNWLSRFLIKELMVIE